MTVTIYVDFENEDVYSEKEYEEVIEQLVELALKEDYNDYCLSFDAWLSDEGYTPSEIFHLNEDEKKDIIQSYKTYADNAIRSSWICAEKEVTI